LFETVHTKQKIKKKHNKSRISAKKQWRQKLFSKADTGQETTVLLLLYRYKKEI